MEKLKINDWLLDEGRGFHKVKCKLDSTSVTPNIKWALRYRHNNETIVK